MMLYAVSFLFLYLKLSHISTLDGKYCYQFYDQISIAFLYIMLLQ